ncbi:hypothetical protein ABZ734_33015 [Streptomyces sp. NPDC006660]|uniref:hypothetical protein n=1 Tax=Streptomyces sp. NPDC006660 TaxID=3156901 RepID=UPI0033F35E20
MNTLGPPGGGEHLVRGPGDPGCGSRSLLAQFPAPLAGTVLVRIDIVSPSGVCLALGGRTEGLVKA